MSKIDLDKEVKRLVQTNCYEKGFVCAVDVSNQLTFENDVILVFNVFKGIIGNADLLTNE